MERADLETKRIVGYFSASKKSAERRWPSRFSSLVSMDAMSMDTSIRVSSGLASS